MSIILIRVRRCVVWRGFGLCRNSVTVSMLKSRNARQFVSHKFSLLFYIIRNAFVVWLVGLLGSVAQFFFRLFFFQPDKTYKRIFFALYRLHMLDGLKKRRREQRSPSMRIENIIIRHDGRWRPNGGGEETVRAKQDRNKERERQRGRKKEREMNRKC